VKLTPVGDSDGASWDSPACFCWARGPAYRDARFPAISQDEEDERFKQARQNFMKKN